METKKTYLIKRSAIFTDTKAIKKTNSKDKAYNDITISERKSFPRSLKLEPGDMLYVAESNGGIYARGIVKEASKEVKEFETIEAVLNFCEKRSDAAYWLNKIHRFNGDLKKNPKTRLRFYEYVIDQKVLERIIPFNGPLAKYIKPGYAHTFIEFNAEDIKYLEKPDYKIKGVKELSVVIPSDLRLAIYVLFNKEESFGHLIDIDHFVPKSVGGPGNIIENLVPIGFSLNRYKSNSIPRSLFEVAKSKFPCFEKEISVVLKDKDDFIKSSKSRKSQDLARKITSKIKEGNINDAREFYFDVLKPFNKKYAERIKDLHIS